MKFINTTFLCLIMFMTSPNLVNAQSLSADAPDFPFGEYLTGRHAYANNQYGDAADNYLRALDLDPENVELNKITITVLITAGKIDEAIKIANRLKDIDQESDISTLLLFFEQAKNKNLDQALLMAEELSSTGILNLVKPIFKAWTLADLGRFDEVEQIISSFEEEAAFNFFNYYQSGLLFEFMGNAQKAELYYFKALGQKGLLNLRAAEAYGAIMRAQQKNGQAITVYKEYVEKAPTNEQLKARLFNAENNISEKPFIENVNQGYAEMFYTVAVVLMQDNISQIATNYLQYALYFSPDFPLAHFMQAQIFENDKYFEGAAEHLNEITNNSPLYFQSKLQRAWLFNEMEQPDEALRAFKKLETEYPKSREVLNSIAEFYRTHARYAEAIPAYNKVVDVITEEIERDWMLYYTRGIVFDQEKRWLEAEKDFQKALELRPEQPMVMNYLAYSWVDQGKNYVKAKGMLERAVELRPNDGYIADSLGWALYKMGDDEEAVGVLERAAQLQTQDWAINDHLGDAYWTIGRKNEARFQWRHALSLSPDADKIDGIKTKIKVGFNKK
ncbi:MAG: tetratricopeptide repeat protein [Kordiimonadaceae bacterium]|nr:tetratricopeptide repeat protein [Kordiimonadaceae bacterium]MBT6035262.1 tetratricopeptide repeat protein [Kordiimonadaceae bacterium]MBT7582349.1 tetratricopeptide repeat protein [Kordiimonadaceae bacterium]